MSFLIDNILKNDSSVKQTPKKIFERNQSTFDNLDKTTSNLNTYSILQHTLLNKINPYYSPLHDCYNSERLYSGVYNNACDKMYFSQNYQDLYLNHAHPYFTLYTRNRFCSTYESLPMMLHMSSKRKGGQVRFNSSQTDALEKRFLSHKYLSPEDRRILADSLKLTDKQVKTWFQNRRAKWRRSNSTSSSTTDVDGEIQGESDSERLFCERLVQPHSIISHNSPLN